jgi:hypothetical protein
MYIYIYMNIYIHIWIYIYVCMYVYSIHIYTVYIGYISICFHIQSFSNVVFISWGTLSYKKWGFTAESRHLKVWMVPARAQLSRGGIWIWVQCEGWYICVYVCIFILYDIIYIYINIHTLIRTYYDIYIYTVHIYIYYTHIKHIREYMLFLQSLGLVLTLGACIGRLCPSCSGA